MPKFFSYTATGRYYKVYRDGILVSKHFQEREALERSNELKFDFPESEVFYTHDYEVDVGLTDAGLTVAQSYAPAVDQPPTIISTPAPSFIQGTPATYEFSQHVSDDGISALTYSLSNVLPNGLTLDSQLGELSYDGIATFNTSSHSLTVSDAVGSDQSVSFDIQISQITIDSISNISLYTDDTTDLSVYINDPNALRTKSNIVGLDQSVATYSSETETLTAVTPGSISTVDLDVSIASQEELHSLDVRVDQDGNHFVPIVSDDGDNLYFAFVNSNDDIVIGKKSPDVPAETVTVAPLYTTQDQFHTVPTIGLDKNGYLHVFGPMHHTEMDYLKSNQPFDVTSGFTRRDAETDGLWLGPDQASGELHRIAYPYIFYDNDMNMWLSYRARVGTSGWEPGEMCGMLAKFNSTSNLWEPKGGNTNADYTGIPGTPSPKPDCFIWSIYTESGTGGYQGFNAKPWIDNAGRLHYAIKHPRDTGSTSWTQDIFYFYSDDEGSTWYYADGTQVTDAPITITNIGSKPSVMWAAGPTGGNNLYDAYASGYSGVPIIGYNKRSVESGTGTTHFSRYDGSWQETDTLVDTFPGRLFVTEDNEWFLVTADTIRFSTDNGTTWTSVSTGYTGSEANANIDTRHFKRTGILKFISMPFGGSNPKSIDIVEYNPNLSQVTSSSFDITILERGTGDEQDWTDRSTASGVFYANNFDYPDRATYLAGAESTVYADYNGENKLDLETSIKLTGNGASRHNWLVSEGANEAGPTWRFSFDGVGAQTVTTKKTKFYYQYSFYADAGWVDFTYEGGDIKTGIIFKPGVPPFARGEVVPTRKGDGPWPGSFRVLSQAYNPTLVWDGTNGSPNGDDTYYTFWDGGAQSEGGETDLTDINLWERRWGPRRRNLDATDPDYANVPQIEGGKWYTFEIHIDLDSTPSPMKIWFAERGQAPILLSGLMDSGLTENDNTYYGIWLLSRAEEAQTQGNWISSDTFVLFDEVIVSDNEIAFPGGYSLPYPGTETPPNYPPSGAQERPRT